MPPVAGIVQSPTIGDGFLQPSKRRTAEAAKMKEIFTLQFWHKRPGCAGTPSRYSARSINAAMFAFGAAPTI